jgi:FAD/FMN-containing dehydrogenase
MIDDQLGHGLLADDMESITAAADDFGHLVHRVPASAALPGSASEVAGLVRHARVNGTELVPRGSGHSVYGQAQSDGGIVCDLTRLDAVAVESASARAGAGARWSTVLDAALARGLTPPVLPDYLELSIGGTLSVGGIGGTSHQYGPIVDHVRGLELVTADGEIQACSPERDRDRFYGVLGTGGSGGIITEALLPLVPTPERVRVYEIPCASAGELVAMQLKVVSEDRADYVEGQILLGEGGDWQFIAELGVYARADRPDSDADLAALAPGEVVSYRDFCYRMTPGVRMLAATGDWYRSHPWFSAFLPADAVEEYVNGALDDATAETVGPVPSLLYPMRRGPLPAPGLETPGGGDELFFALSILRTTVTEKARDAALQSNAKLAQTVVSMGGTVYRISAVPIGWGSMALR